MEKGTNILCDCKVFLKFKEKIYKMIIKLVMLYGVECWVMNRVHEQKIIVVEMRM